jgi:hypothetical protein
MIDLVKLFLLLLATPLGLLTSYTDLREWYLYDRHIAPYIVTMPVFMAAVFLWEHNLHTLAIYFIYFLVSVAFAAGLAYAGVWTHADAALFVAYSAILPDPIQLFANTTLLAIPLYLFRRNGRYVPLAPAMFVGFVLLVLFGRWIM